MVDSMEYIEREYVLVGNMIPSTESLSMTAIYVGKVVGSPQKNSISSATTATLTTGTRAMVMLSGGHGSPTCSKQPQRSCSGWRVHHLILKPDSSFKRCARLITVLASDKLEAGQFAIQLVCLAIWKESLHACHTWAAVAAEENGQTYSGGVQEADHEAALATPCSMVEREFSEAVDRAGDLASHVRALDGYTELQDAMDLIYQAALAVGRAGAVEELMGYVSNAAVAYAKAAALFYFLLVEAPYLPLNPSLVLNSVDRQRLRRYADAITIRQNQCTAQREAIQEQQSIY